MVAGQLTCRRLSYLNRIAQYSTTSQIRTSQRCTPLMTFHTHHFKSPVLYSYINVNIYAPITSSYYQQIAQIHTSRKNDEESNAQKAAKIIAETMVNGKSSSEASNSPKKEQKGDSTQSPEQNAKDKSPAVKTKTPTTHEEAESHVKTGTSVPAVKPSLPRRAWIAIVRECKHYYHGFRLLFIDVKICTKYVWRLLRGRNLTRRERRQLVRTAADLFRLVPFIPFIIVPFMEFLLPVALKVFPGMLPSTFQEADKEIKKKTMKLKARLEVAKFLQDTVEESALQQSSSKEESENTRKLAREFSEFMTHIRDEGTTASNADIIKFSQLFKDDITLDNMSRPHLVALCKLLDIQPIGPRGVLVLQLRLKLRSLKADDKMIQKEGMDSLTNKELQTACRARGMRAIGVSEWRLKYQLSQWLDLHLKRNVPTSLLLMSRALYLPEHLSTNEKLERIMKDLPNHTAEEAELHAADLTGETVNPQAKSKALLDEEEAIKQEKMEAEKMDVEEKERQKSEAKSEDLAENLNSQTDLDRHTIIDKATVLDSPPPAPKDSMTQLDKSPDIPPVPGASPAMKKEQEAVLSHSEVEMLEDALEKVAEEKNPEFKPELDDLRNLLDDVEIYQKVINGGIVSQDLGTLKESKSAKRLSGAVDRMIKGLGPLTDDLFKQKQEILEDIEVKEVKMKRSEALLSDEAAMAKMSEQVEAQKENVISLNELVLAMKRIQKIPDDTRLQTIVKVLDEDEDGIINITNALQVLQEIGTENVQINQSQMTKILDMIKSEQESLKAAKQDECQSGEENGKNGTAGVAGAAAKLNETTCSPGFKEPTLEDKADTLSEVDATKPEQPKQPNTKL